MSRLGYMQKGEDCKIRDEESDRRVKQFLFAENVAQFGIDDHEDDRDRQYPPYFQEGNRFSAGARSRDDQERLLCLVKSCN